MCEVDKGSKQKEAQHVNYITAEKNMHHRLTFRGVITERHKQQLTIRDSNAGYVHSCYTDA